MFFGARGVAASILLLLAGHAASGAVSIQYSLVPLGGNVYKYVYSITNTGPGASVQLFDILFDTSLYQESSLQIITPNPLHTQWSEQLLGSLPGVPAAYDALSLSGGIPPGTTVSGFSVQFTWLGSGTPGSQPFQIFNPTTFALLQSGQTSLPATVPAASALTMILIGLGLALTVAHHLRMQHGQMSA